MAGTLQSVTVLVANVSTMSETQPVPGQVRGQQSSPLFSQRFSARQQQTEDVRRQK